MKKTLFTSSLVSLIFSTLTFAQPQAGHYQIDTDHSSIHFTVDHMGFSKVAGRFNHFVGEVEVSEKGTSTLDLSITSSSVDTNHEKRDDHLRSPDFFNSKQFPVIQIEGPIALADGSQVEAQVELLGIKKPVKLTLTKGKEGADPWGMYRVGYIASTQLKRSDFGMNFMLGGIGDEIQITAYIEAVKK